MSKAIESELEMPPAPPTVKKKAPPAPSLPPKKPGASQNPVKKQPGAFAPSMMKNNSIPTPSSRSATLEEPAANEEKESKRISLDEKSLLVDFQCFVHHQEERGGRGWKLATIPLQSQSTSLEIEVEIENDIAQSSEVDGARGERQSVKTNVKDDPEQFVLMARDHVRQLECRGTKEGWVEENHVILEDLVMLHEATLIRFLQTRFHSDCIYSAFSGEGRGVDVTVALKPNKEISEGIDVNTLLEQGREIIPTSTKLKDDERGGKNKNFPPHPWITANNAYFQMWSSKKNQCVLISGEDHTEFCNHVNTLMLQFLNLLSDWRERRQAGNDDNDDRVQQQSKANSRLQCVLNDVLPSFVCAKTTLSKNSCRATQCTRVHFRRKDGLTIGSDIRYYQLEKSRILLAPPQERVYHVFYQILAGNVLKKSGETNEAQSFKICRSGNMTDVEGLNDVEGCANLCKGLTFLGFSDEEQNTIWHVLLGIGNLGNVEFESFNEGSEITKSTKPFMRITAEHWGLEEGNLEEILIQVRVTIAGQSIIKHLSQEKASDRRDTICRNMYEKVLEYLLEKLNQVLKPTEEPSSAEKPNIWISILQTSSLEDQQQRPFTNSAEDDPKEKSAPNNSFEAFCNNYLQEFLHQFYLGNFHDEVVAKLSIMNSSHPRDATESAEQKLLRNDLEIGNKTLLEEQMADVKKRTDAARHIFKLLDEECLLGKATVSTFIDKIENSQLSKNVNHDGNKAYISLRGKPEQRHSFGIQHFRGPVKYAVDGWLEKNRDIRIDKDYLSNLMENSKNESIAEHFSLSSQQKAQEAKGRRLTVGQRFIMQVEDIMQEINATTPHWIHCIIPTLSNNAPKEFHSGHISQQLHDSGMMRLMEHKTTSIGRKEEMTSSNDQHIVRINLDQYFSRYQCILCSFPSSSSDHATPTKMMTEKEYQSELHTKNYPLLCSRMVNILSEQITTRKKATSSVEKKMVHFSSSSIVVGNEKVFLTYEAYRALELLRKFVVTQYEMNVTEKFSEEEKNVLKRVFAETKNIPVDADVDVNLDSILMNKTEFVDFYQSVNNSSDVPLATLAQWFEYLDVKGLGKMNFETSQLAILVIVQKVEPENNRNMHALSVFSEARAIRLPPEIEGELKNLSGLQSSGVYHYAGKTKEEKEELKECNLQSKEVLLHPPPPAQENNSKAVGKVQRRETVYFQKKQTKGKLDADGSLSTKNIEEELLFYVKELRRHLIALCEAIFNYFTNPSATSSGNNNDGTHSSFTYPSKVISWLITLPTVSNTVQLNYGQEDNKKMIDAMLKKMHRLFFEVMLPSEGENCSVDDEKQKNILNRILDNGAQHQDSPSSELSTIRERHLLRNCAKMKSAYLKQIHEVSSNDGEKMKTTSAGRPPPHSLPTPFHKIYKQKEEEIEISQTKLCGKELEVLREMLKEYMTECGISRQAKWIQHLCQHHVSPLLVANEILPSIFLYTVDSKFCNCPNLSACRKKQEREEGIQALAATNGEVLSKILNEEENKKHFTNHRQKPVGVILAANEGSQGRNPAPWAVANFVLRVANSGGDDADKNVALAAKTIHIFQPFIETLDNALCCLPPVRRVVYRGLKVPVAQHYNLSTNLCWPSFTSTSLVGEEALSFMKPSEQGTFFLIRVCQAAMIDFVSWFPEQREALIPSFSKFRVKFKMPGAVIKMLQWRMDIVTLEQEGHNEILDNDEMVDTVLESTEPLRFIFKKFLARYVEVKVIAVSSMLQQQRSTSLTATHDDSKGIFQFIEANWINPSTGKEGVTIDDILLTGKSGSGKTTSGVALWSWLSTLHRDQYFPVFLWLPFVGSRLARPNGVKESILDTLGIDEAQLHLLMAKRILVIILDSFDESPVCQDVIEAGGIFALNPWLTPSPAQTQKMKIFLSCRIDFIESMHGNNSWQEEKGHPEKLILYGRCDVEDEKSNNKNKDNEPLLERSCEILKIQSFTNDDIVEFTTKYISARIDDNDDENGESSVLRNTLLPAGRNKKSIDDDQQIDETRIFLREKIKVISKKISDCLQNNARTTRSPAFLFLLLNLAVNEAIQKLESSGKDGDEKERVRGGEGNEDSFGTAAFDVAMHASITSFLQEGKEKVPWEGKLLEFHLAQELAKGYQGNIHSMPLKKEMREIKRIAVEMARQGRWQLSIQQVMEILKDVEHLKGASAPLLERLLPLSRADNNYHTSTSMEASFGFWHKSMAEHFAVKEIWEGPPAKIHYVLAKTKLSKAESGLMYYFKSFCALDGERATELMSILIRLFTENVADETLRSNVAALLMLAAAVSSDDHKGGISELFAGKSIVDCQLQEADFSRCNLTDTTFLRCNLTQAKFFTNENNSGGTSVLNNTLFEKCTFQYFHQELEEASTGSGEYPPMFMSQWVTSVDAVKNAFYCSNVSPQVVEETNTEQEREQEFPVSTKTEIAEETSGNSARAKEEEDEALRQQQIYLDHLLGDVLQERFSVLESRMEAQFGELQNNVAQFQGEVNAAELRVSQLEGKVEHFVANISHSTAPSDINDDESRKMKEGNNEMSDSRISPDLEFQQQLSETSLQRKRKALVSTLSLYQELVSGREGSSSSPRRDASTKLKLNK